MKLDDIDIKTLKASSQDGRMPNTSIVKEFNVHLSIVPGQTAAKDPKVIDTLIWQEKETG